ncbi:BRM1L protein, partial [Polypterus senegalus]
MPVHSRDKKEANHEEMEVDYPEHEGTSSDEEDTESSSVSEDGDSSEMDDADCERRRMECLDEMTNLEKQFTDLKDQLYKERLSQVDAKLQEVIAGKAPEYLEPLATLQENMQIRTKVAGIYRELCLESVKNKYDCEIQAALQHCESEKLLLYDTVQSELEEKIRRLEEDRHSIDITSASIKSEKHQHSAHSEDGRLFYDGEWYNRGQRICIDKKDEYPTSMLLLDYVNFPLGLIKYLSIVEDCRLPRPVRTPRPTGGALPTARSCPEVQQGLMDSVVFIHSPAGYLGNHQESLWGDLWDLLCLMTREYVTVT